MAKITINLTDEQEKFLKLFSKNHYPGAHDNVCTPQPIHVVQSYNPSYVPFGEDTAEYYDSDDLRFCWDSEYGMWFKSDIEAIKGWYDYHNEECPIPIEPFSQLEFEEIEDVTGQEVQILDYKDYFKAYGIEWIAMAWELEDWKDIAYFFILEEAKRYMDYQSHNLKKPRTYTLHGGYSNKGEYHHFWQLLYDIGKELNDQMCVYSCG
ncbi:hypothetical protein DEAC_c14040 [Desulfosporosinus acididurans]|uniref:Uncharacterized protein n=1 Tax=Desulfosporosinus acididurans TaxID=476652 RepID=A0A0J1IPW5_9FIRM|nr:hypothetical protein [Desulfosporosinus acididurans]KLU66736.1 hypothetical protein DEAC_c14040 [Desulfosporosinus acididurans]